MVNKTVGNRFEGELCDTLYRNGFWAHNIAQNRDGQPADVIAVRGEMAHLIDCKDCASNVFPLSRIEDNQEGAMTVWEQSGNTSCLFALRLTDEAVYMVPFDSLCELRMLGVKALTEKAIRRYTPLEEWMVAQP